MMPTCKSGTRLYEIWRGMKKNVARSLRQKITSTTEAEESRFVMIGHDVITGPACPELAA